MISRRAGQWALLLVAAGVLSGCEEGQDFALFKKNPDAGATGAETGAAPAATSTRLVERDVEAPEVYQATDSGLWDGRPSLGGVWVAASDVKDPERVIIRNEANGKFVIGALFRRERENPGPRIQVSSDAAAALGMLAGQPAGLNVTAMRREEVPVESPADAETVTLGTPDMIAEAPLAPAAPDAPVTAASPAAKPPGGAPVATIAAAAIEKAERMPARDAAPKPAQKPAATTRPKPAGLDKPFIQIGIFSVEGNATNTATAMRNDGMLPEVRKSTAKGKSYWRVLVGPAGTGAERAALLRKVKALGFTDAYFVGN